MKFVDPYQFKEQAFTMQVAWCRLAAQNVYRHRLPIISSWMWAEKMQLMPTDLLALPQC